MRILWVGTKPPWPPIDGGRLLAALTLEALAQAGHALTLVAPFDAAREDPAPALEGLRPWCEPVLVPTRPRSFLRAGIASMIGKQPLSVVRHSLAAVGGRVATLLANRPFDVVHAEQPQALAQCADAFARGLPVVLRAQNVESDLWAAAGAMWPVTGVLARLEARRMARFEGQAVRGTSATLALTARDAERLRALSGMRDKVHCVPPPFPTVLPGADAPLAGEPAVVLMGSGGWLPNQEGADWFLRAVWPGLRAALPRAVLHLFGDVGRANDAPGLVRHASLADSRQAFASNAVLVVPLPFGSGVRMKVLEAWARGVPVVATPAAAEGLEARDGRELMLARTARDFISALKRLSLEPGLASSLVGAGRTLLAARHDPAEVASRIAGVYAACLSRVTPTP